MEYKDKYDLIFITTHQSNLYIYNLLDSIKSVEELKLFVVVLSQGIELDVFNYKSIFDIEVVSVNKMSLSKARNIGLDFLKKNNILANFIMFPDDDTVFDELFFKNFTFLKESEISFIIPIYELMSSPKKLYMGEILDEGTIVKEIDHHLIGSPNQVIRYSKNSDVLYFDEKLGVGALYGSCEDYDLFIRLNRAGEEFLFTSQLYNFHPKKTDIYINMNLAQILKRFKNYSAGFCYIIFKYNLKKFIFMYLFRTLAASGYFLLKLNFKLSYAYLMQFFFRVFLIVKFKKMKVC